MVDRLPELLVEAVRQAHHQCKPPMLFHSPQRLMDRPAAGKRVRQRVTQVKEMKVLAPG
jgi:hypothetical protein